MNERFVWVFHLLIALLLLPNHSWADEQHYGYRITTSGKTVIQIARDVYNDERQWKKIAYWNNLTAPYALSVGQILVLPQKPKVELSENNLVVGAQVPTPKFLEQLPSVSRVIWNRKGYYVYEVNERAPSLSMVALENYGDKNMWKFIARWNGLAQDEHLSLSQKLILREKPTQTPKQANAVLIKEWVRVGNIPMAQRLGHPGPFAPAPKLAEPNLSQQKLDAVEPFAVKQVEQKTQPKPVEAETPTKNIEHESSSEHAEADSRAKDVQKSTATKLNEPARATSSTTAPTPDAYPSSVTPTSVTSPAVPSLPSMPSLPSLTSDEPVLKGSKQLPPKKVQSVVTEPTSLGQPLKTLEAPTLTPPSNINSRIIDPSDDPELAPQAEKYVQPTQTVQQPTQTIPPAPAQVTQPVQSAPQQLQQPAPVAQPVVQQPAPAPAAPATPVATPPTATAPAQPEPERKPTAATTPTDSSQLLEPAHESYWLGSDTINIMKSLSKPNGK